MKIRDYSKNKRGSNQYRNKERGDWKKILAVYLWLFVFLPGALITYGKYQGSQAMADELEKVAGSSAQVVRLVATPTPLPEKTRQEQQVEIERYIRTIFGKYGKLAVAVSRNECGVTYKTYPRCRYTTTKEDSIGIYQINIQSKEAKVHWARIPGNTLEEKVEWLKNPQNNTLMAYWIFTASGDTFNAWSAYTSGRYMKDM
jgi:hypothetical protein